jgi:NTP pyrophosphatase (non-canonical NTP hydrolase)
MSVAYANFVRRLFVKRNEGADGLLHAALGIGGEAGEIVDAIKKHWVTGKPLDRENLVEEIGDVMFYMQALCNQLGITMTDAVIANMDKLNKRYPEGYSDAAAIARADKA